MMALDDFGTNFNYFLRWFHIIAGITWIGLLYFFNFVNIPFQSAIGADNQPKVNPHLLPRALFFFRWGAMITFVVGWTLLFHKYQVGNLWFSDDGTLAGRTAWILYGAAFGSIMWFNVWFIIWPAQKKMLSGQATAEEKAVLKPRAAMASRINTYFSAPMLFGMIGPNNYGAFSWTMAVVVALVGFAIIKLTYMMSLKVQSM